MGILVSRDFKTRTALLLSLKGPCFYRDISYYIAWHEKNFLKSTKFPVSWSAILVKINIRWKFRRLQKFLCRLTRKFLRPRIYLRTKIANSSCSSVKSRTVMFECQSCSDLCLYRWLSKPWAWYTSQFWSFQTSYCSLVCLPLKYMYWLYSWRTFQD